MVRTKNRLWICSLLLLLNIAFIWGNSLLPGEISAAISRGLRTLLELLFDSGEGGADVQSGDGFLRKLAHLGEFACLGVLLRWLFGMLRQKKWQYYCWPVIAGVVVACVDETIQMFIPDRGPNMKDVGIDTLGLVLGIVIISLITHIKSKNKLKENVL